MRLEARSFQFACTLIALSVTLSTLVKCTYGETRTSDAELQRDIGQILRSLTPFLEFAGEIEVERVIYSDDKQSGAGQCTVKLRENGSCQYDLKYKQVTIFRSSKRCGDEATKNPNVIIDKENAQDTCLEFIGHLLPEREVKLKNLELYEDEMSPYRGCWEASFESLFDGIVYLGADVVVQLSASSGKILAFTQVPVETPSSFEKRCSKESAVENAMDYVQSEVPDTTYEIIRKPELVVIPGHLPIFASLKQIMSGGIQELPGKTECRVAWQVYMREKSKMEIRDHTTREVSVLVDASTGLAIGVIPMW